MAVWELEGFYFETTYTGSGNMWWPSPQEVLQDLTEANLVYLCNCILMYGLLHNQSICTAHCLQNNQLRIPIPAICSNTCYTQERHITASHDCTNQNICSYPGSNLFTAPKKAHFQTGIIWINWPHIVNLHGHFLIWKILTPNKWHINSPTIKIYNSLICQLVQNPFRDA